MELPKGWTPGPWWADAADHIVADGGYDVALIGRFTDYPNSNANAALIALAPTMAAWIEGEPARTAEAVAAARREALEQAAAWHDKQEAFYAERLWRTPPACVAGDIFAQCRAISVAAAAAIRAMKDEH